MTLYGKATAWLGSHPWLALIAVAVLVSGFIAVSIPGYVAVSNKAAELNRVMQSEDAFDADLHRYVGSPAQLKVDATRCVREGPVSSTCEAALAILGSRTDPNAVARIRGLAALSKDDLLRRVTALCNGPERQLQTCSEANIALAVQRDPTLLAGGLIKRQ